MAHTWVDGEVITADKLNNTNDIFVVTFSYEEEGESGGGDASVPVLVCDKTYNEIINAYNSGKILVGKLYYESDGFYFSTGYNYSQSEQIIDFAFAILFNYTEDKLGSYISGSTGYIGIQSDDTVLNALHTVKITNEVE